MAVVAPPLTVLGQHQARIARLELTVLILSVSVLVLVSLGAWTVWQGVPVYFVPPGGPGLAQPGVIDDATAMDYASRWLRTRYTFTPTTVKAAHAEILTALHPSLTITFQAQADREVLLVKEAHLSTQVGILATAVRQRAGQAVTVHIDARRTVWIGGQEVREEPFQADITVVPWVTRGTPAGLVVSKVTTMRALSAGGA